MYDMFAKFCWIVLFTFSVVGIFYIFSQRYTIRDGYRGISYDNGQLKVLEPGVHWLISPFHTLDRIIPFQQDNSLRLAETRVKTTDNIEIKLQADIIYKVVNAESFVLHASANPTQLLADQASGILSNIYLSYSLEQISPNPIQDEHHDELHPKERTHQKDGTPIHQRVRDTFMAQFTERAKNWGVEITYFQITKFDFVDAAVMEKLAQPTITNLEANAKLRNARALAAATRIEAEGQASKITTEATARAEAIGIEATARAKAMATLAEGVKKAVEACKSDDPESSAKAFQLLQLRTQGEILANCGSNVTLITGSGNGGPLFLGSPISNVLPNVLAPAPSIAVQG